MIPLLSRAELRGQDQTNRSMGKLPRTGTLIFVRGSYPSATILRASDMAAEASVSPNVVYLIAFGLASTIVIVADLVAPTVVVVACIAVLICFSFQPPRVAVRRKPYATPRAGVQRYGGLSGGFSEITAAFTIPHPSQA
jgi:hypothetical protein